MAYVLQLDIVVKNDTKGKLLTMLNHVICEMLELPGCFFTSGEVFDGESEGDVSRVTAQLRCKSSGGLDKYFAHHAAEVKKEFEAFGEAVSVVDKVLSRRGDVAYPIGTVDMATSKTSKPEVVMFQRKRQIVPSPTKPKEEGGKRPEARDMAPSVPSAGITLSQVRSSDVRFHDLDGPRHKAAAVPVDGAVGITSETLALREDLVRFDSAGSKRILGSPTKPDDSAAGVRTERQIREVDRYHQENKPKPTVRAPDPDAAGVATASQLREVDRYHGEVKIRGTKVPDSDAAGVATDKQLREIDRYQGVPKVRGAVEVNDRDGTAGVVTSKQIREVDRYFQDPKRRGASAPVPDGAVKAAMDLGEAAQSKAAPPPSATVAANATPAGIASLKQTREVDRYTNGNKGRLAPRQPPGGASSVIFG